MGVIVQVGVPDPVDGGGVEDPDAVAVAVAVGLAEADPVAVGMGVGGGLSGQQTPPSPAGSCTSAGFATDRVSERYPLTGQGGGGVPPVVHALLVSPSPQLTLVSPETTPIPIRVS
jgi:hypothetical protein